MSRFQVGDKVCYLGGHGESDFKELIIAGLYTVEEVIMLYKKTEQMLNFKEIPNVYFIDGNYFMPYPYQLESNSKIPSLQWVQHSRTKKYVIIEGLIWCYINQQLIDGATKFVATNGYTNEVICACDTFEYATLQAEAYYSELIEKVFEGDFQKNME